MITNSCASIMLGLLVVLCLPQSQAEAPVLTNELLSKEIDPTSAESVGRHFLHALATGDREKAESLMLPSKIFWGSDSQPNFPYEKAIASALMAAANDEAKSRPSATPDQISNLSFGGIEIALVTTEKSNTWKVGTGLLFSTRSGLVFPASLNIELKEKEKMADATPDAESPFQLFETKGKPHSMLTQATHWMQEHGVGFDGMMRTDFRRYKDGEMGYWTHKSPSKNFFPDEQLQKMTDTVTKEKKMPYQAWSSVIHHDDTIETYTLDAEHQTLFFGTLQQTAKNTWFAGQVRLKIRSEENLYQFDRSPFEHDKGSVTHTQITQDLLRGEEAKKTIVTEAFATTHQSDQSREIWIITLGEANSPRHLYRIHWKDGSDIFHPNNYYLNGGLKAEFKEAAPKPPFPLPRAAPQCILRAR